MPALVERGLERLRRAAAATDGWPGRRSVVVGLACVAAMIAVAAFAQRHGFADLALHRDAIRAWLSGDDLYAYRSPDSHLGFPLPPATALVLAPTALVPLGVAGWLTASASIAVLVLALIVLVGPVARRHARRRWLAVGVAAALALATEPVRKTLGLGHLDLLLFGLVVADVVALRRRALSRRRALWWPGRPAAGHKPAGHRGIGRSPLPAALRGRIPETLRRGWRNGSWAGVGIGLASALAAGPALFIGYLALTRQWRATVTALGTSLGTTTAAYLVAPGETADWFTNVLWRIDRTGPVDATGNQSLAGVLARFYDSATTPILLWLSFALLLLAVGLIRARSAHAEGDEAAAFTLVGLTGLAIGPTTETYGLVWMLPAVLILIDVAARRHTASRLPSRRKLLAARRGLSAPRPSAARLHRTVGRRPRALRGGYGTSPAGIGSAITGVGVYLTLVAAPMWAYRHQLPETSHYADGFVGMLLENAIGFALILLVAALPWRPGASPAFHANPWAPTAKRRPIPPARRPIP
jgi:alpha-1,2-mannosyltransferase